VERVPSFDHVPVLLAEVLDALAPRPGGIYVDGTLGGGGHARAVLERIGPDGRLIAIDRDPSALAAAQAQLADLAGRLTTVHGTFGAIDQHLAGLGVGPVDGILLDVGVSSPQLDHADRGFSFSREGPLDMRMDPTQGPTALELLRDRDEGEISTILRDYGEERYHKRISRMIKEAIAKDALHTTTDLARLCVEAIPNAEQRKSKIHAATRTFQGLRIAVNGELDELARFLAVFPDLLATGGRCAVISFHSLEDRLVKQRFRDLAWASSLPPALAAQAGERPLPVCVPVQRKAVFAGDEETDDNPRARSARLRACERTAAPNVPAGLAGPDTDDRRRRRR
jgi:16S rRNA (cytosine1402-N4)-methyltransferase